MNKEKHAAVVVNDDATQLEVFSGLLRKMGMEVISCDNADKALRLMCDSPVPSVIVTDLHMPDISGWDFCRLLRSPEYSQFNDVPIVVVSATFAGDHVEAITTELGANAFLSLPLEPGQFADEVEKVIGGGKSKQMPRVMMAVDDEQKGARVVQKFELHGYEAFHATTGKEAVKSFIRHHYDIVILQHRLPDIAASKLMLELKELRPRTAAIIVTEDASPAFAAEWMKQGAAAYVREPYDPEYLVRLCDRIRREKALMRVEDLLEDRTRQLQKREEEYRLIVDNQSELICKWLPDMRLTFVNDAYCRYFGRSKKELLFSRFVDSVAEGCKEHLKEKIRGMIESPATQRCECEVIDSGGEFRCMQWVWRPIFDAEGTLTQVLSVGRDITERRNYGMEMKRLSEAINQVKETVVITDTEGVIEYVNPSFYELTGYSAGEVKGKKPSILKSGQQGQGFYRELWDTITSGEVWRGTMVNKRKDGSLYTESCSISPVKKENGEIYNFVAIKKDISKELELEEHINQVQKLETVERLAAGVAHDINNFLLPVLGYSEILMNGMERGTKEYAQLDQIQNAALKSRDLIRQLLAFGRKQVLDFKVVDVCEIVSDFSRLLDKMLREDIEINMSLPHEKLFVKADKVQIGQVLMNLAVNAQDAMPGGGALELEVSFKELDRSYCAVHKGASPGDYAMLSITDNGCGMDDEALRHAFDPFFTTKGEDGTGLGLSTVYGIVKQHGGNVWAYSEMGRGSIFRIYLPVASEPPDAPVERKKVNPEGGKETILVVEDDEVVRNIICDMLAEFGYECLCAPDGTSALNKAGEQGGAVDLLLTDVVMPGMNGPEVYERIQQQYPDIKVVFMSGYAAGNACGNELIGENSSFMQKPFSIDSLACKVREVLEGRQKISDPQVS